MIRFFHWIARLMAYLGGIVLSALILLICVSIAGRTINALAHSDFANGLAPGFAEWLLSTGVGPINGDFELVEAGIAFAIFSFLPLAQFTGAHAAVDIFTNFLSVRVNRVLRAGIEVLFAVFLVIIAYQLFLGTETKLRTGTTTFLLQFPLWWSYAFSLVPAATAAVVAVFMAYIRIVESLTGTVLVVDEGETEH